MSGVERSTLRAWGLRMAPQRRSSSIRDLPGASTLLHLILKVLLARRGARARDGPFLGLLGGTTGLVQGEEAGVDGPDAKDSLEEVLGPGAVLHTEEDVGVAHFQGKGKALSLEHLSDSPLDSNQEVARLGVSPKAHIGGIANEEGLFHG